MHRLVFDRDCKLIICECLEATVPLIEDHREHIYDLLSNIVNDKCIVVYTEYSNVLKVTEAFYTVYANSFRI